MTMAAALKKLFGKRYEKVGALQAAEMVDGGAVLLDVREPHEWRIGHAPKARHIPLGQLEQRLKEVPPSRPIVTVCRSGARSARAARLLAARGRQVSNLSGGMHAWARADLPIVAKGAKLGRVG